MPAFDTSPLPLRHHHKVSQSRTPPRVALNMDGSDDMGEATIPCSPAAFLPPMRDATQPTQILSRQGLSSQRSSSPSIVEVPASSPFQSPAKRMPQFASRLAPAGTMFRPPPKQPQPKPAQSSKALGAPNAISLLSDDDDDLTPPRGDIRPTTFKSQISAYRYDAAADAKRKKNLRIIFDTFGDRFPAELVQRALKQCQDDVEAAIAWLERHHAGYGKSNKAKRGFLEDSDEELPSARSISASMMKARAQQPSTPPKPARRRLVQGLKKRSSPTLLSSPVKEPPSSDDPLVIDLVDNDEQDAYQAEESPPSSQDGDGKILESINTSELKDLMAMTGLKEAVLAPFIAKRPFDSLSAARAVTVAKKTNAGKRSRDATGDIIVDALEEFINAVTAIDEVVAKCEAKAQAVKEVMDTWDLDSFGRNKLRDKSPAGHDLPPTPTSERSRKLTKPPIPQQPESMDGNCQMKPFQLFGLNWMSLLRNFDIGCILADEMGLGKTCQVISLIAQLVAEHQERPKGRRPWPNLIVVPPSTYNNWLGEFKKFAPSLSVIGYRGSQDERADIAWQVQEEPELYHAVIATYSQLGQEPDIEAMASLGFNAAIFDEGHQMKNPETKRYKDLKRIPAAWKLLLTGTPVQNNLLEMTSLLNFINPTMFDGYMHHIQFIFSQKVTIRDVSNGAFLYSERVSRARTILEPFILQRRKDQVLSDMPKKITTVVNCPMTTGQKRVYDDKEAMFRLEPSKRAAAAKGRGNDNNNIWMQLRKAALHPLLFRQHFSDAVAEKMAKVLMQNVEQAELQQPDLKHLTQELKNSSDFELHLWCRDYPNLLSEFDIAPSAENDSGKVQKMLEMIAQYQENGDRVLVFSKFSRIIELLQEVLAQHGINHLVLSGATSVAERQDLIDEFNNDRSIPVFLLTTGAGGTGINLTAANKVIIFDQSDNPQDDIQAENRAHRLGQTRDVEIIRLLSTGTIEELIYKACLKKIELAEKVTGKTAAEEAVEKENLEVQVRKMMAEQLTPP